MGNIIKNEALHAAGLHPTTPASALDAATTRILVRATRDFSMLFLSCRRGGRPVEPECVVYARCAPHNNQQYYSVVVVCVFSLPFFLCFIQRDAPFSEKDP